MKYKFANALEQFNDEIDAINEDVLPTETQVEADDAVVDTALKESGDLGDDLASINEATSSLESLAIALESDIFQTHPASLAEVRSVNIALEAYDLVPTAKEGDDKKTLGGRVKEAARRLWEWLQKMAAGAIAWVREMISRISKPMQFAVSRAEAALSAAKENFSEVDPAKFTAKLGYSGSVDKGMAELNNTVKRVVDISNSIDPMELINYATGEGDSNAMAKKMSGVIDNLMTVYTINQKDSNQTKTLIGGHALKLVVSRNKLSINHKAVKEDVKTAPTPAKSVGDLQKIVSAIKESEGVWKNASKALAAYTDSKIDAKIKEASKKDKELTDEDRSVLSVIPGLIKGPLADSVIVLAKVTLAAVSFTEAHAKKSSGDKKETSGGEQGKLAIAGPKA